MVSKKLPYDTNGLPYDVYMGDSRPQCSKRHNDVTPEDLSERWCISLNQAASTIKRTTQNLSLIHI